MTITTLATVANLIRKYIGLDAIEAILIKAGLLLEQRPQDKT